jgi:hypothetical protein
MVRVSTSPERQRRDTLSHRWRSGFVYDHSAASGASLLRRPRFDDLADQVGFDGRVALQARAALAALVVQLVRLEKVAVVDQQLYAAVNV